MTLSSPSSRSSAIASLIVRGSQCARRHSSRTPISTPSLSSTRSRVSSRRCARPLRFWRSSSTMALPTVAGRIITVIGSLSFAERVHFCPVLIIPPGWQFSPVAFRKDLESQRALTKEASLTVTTPPGKQPKGFERLVGARRSKHYTPATDPDHHYSASVSRPS